MWIEMKCELCFDNNCLDLPSLTKIQGAGSGIHKCIGHLVLEGMFIQIGLIRLD